MPESIRAATRKTKPNRSGVTRARVRAWLCASAVFLGAWLIANPTISRPGDASDPAPLFAAAIASAAIALLMRGRAGGLSLVLSMLFLGAGWSSMRLHHPPPGSLAAIFQTASADPAAAPPLVRMEGVITEAPTLSAEPTGLDRFLFAEQRTRFRMRINTVITDDGAVAASGRVLVSVPSEGWGDRALRPGDRVRITGLLRPVTGPMNPGELDRRPYAVQSGEAGVVVVSSAELIEPITARKSWTDTFARWRFRIRTRAAEALAAHGDEGGVVAAMTLGVREAGADDTQRAFARAGVAHLLAVSGFHLGVLAWLTLGVVRLHGDHGRLAAVLAAVVIVAYLILVPARAPIVRASALALALLLAEILGRRWDRLTILGWISAALVFWRPADTLGLGLPLSVGVTAMLLYISAKRNTLVFGPRPLRGVSVARSLWMRIAGWVRSYAVVCVLAWLASVPLVAMKIGVVSPVGPVAAMVLTPLATVTLTLGFVAVLVSFALPPAAPVFAQAAGWVGATMDAIVRMFEAAPGSAFEITGVGWLWFVIASAGFVLVMRARAIRDWRVLVGVGVPAAWLAVVVAIGPALPRAVAMRVDMLSVGNGSCLLLRSGDEAILWDCGSLRGGIADRMMPRALRSLGAGPVDQAVLTHSNIDHYNGLAALADSGGLERLTVSRASWARVTAAPSTAEAALRTSLQVGGVDIARVEAGDVIRFGDATLRFIWPGPNDATDDRGRARSENDLSLVAVLEVETAGGPRRVLLTGDVQSGAIGAILERDLVGSIDAMELPHHGSFNGPAMELVRRSGAQVVLQSTGPRRARNQAWRPAIGAVIEDGGAWWVTARDGAGFIEFRRDGSVRTGTMRDNW